MIAALSADGFEKLDYRVMGHAYSSQNELGRLCDECVYEADMKARLLADGFRSVQTQVPVTVTHRDFSKTYRLDMVADDALYFRVDDHNQAAFGEAEAFPPLSYEKGGRSIDLSFWRAPERLFDEPDELMTWARAAAAAAHRVATKRGRTTRRKSKPP